MYPLMTTVSLLVDEIHPGVATLRDSIGLIEQRPAAYRTGPGISALFCRVHPKYAVAPTFLELVAPAPANQSSDPASRHETAGTVFPLAAVRRRQGQRSIHWHATEIAMSDEDVADLAQHLAGLGVEVGWHPPDKADRFYAAGDPASPDFDPAVDGGLFLEAMKFSGLKLPEDVLTAPADVPSDARPDAMIRVEAREYLVEDLDEVLSALKRALRWEPSSVSDEDGCRRAVMPFSAPRSAQLELLQPTAPGRVADAYDELGPGAWTVRISVGDIDAKAKDLADRGTPYSLEGGVLRPDRAVTLGVPFEFAAAPRPR